MLRCVRMHIALNLDMCSRYKQIKWRYEAKMMRVCFTPHVSYALLLNRCLQLSQPSWRKLHPWTLAASSPDLQPPSVEDCFSFTLATGLFAVCIKGNGVMNFNLLVGEDKSLPSQVLWLRACRRQDQAQHVFFLPDKTDCSACVCYIIMFYLG